jgi:integrase
MKYSVKFYPEKRKGIFMNVPVMLSVNYSQGRMFYYTGLRCNLNQWDYTMVNKKQKNNNRLLKNQVTPDDYTSEKFNKELVRIEGIIYDLFEDYGKVPPTMDQLRNNLKTKLGKEIKKAPEPEKEGFFDRWDKYIKDAPLSAGRKMHLKTTRIKIQKFDTKRKKTTTFKEVDSQYLTDFQNFLIDDCKLSKNTAISELRRFRAFFGWAIEKKWTTIQPFTGFEIGTESFGDPVYITVAERDKLFNAKIKVDYLARVRDIFVFQCCIGCRVGDLVKLKKSNIVNGCIEYIAGKTKDEKPRIARIPLTEKAKIILSRYNEPDGSLLPFISDQKYNTYIKQLFKLDNIKINRMVTIMDPKTRQSKQVPISTVASSHMARRVFVGSLYHKGVKDSIIASMSGHAENSKAFSRYYKVEQADQQKAISLIE